ncbi:hypothetical protein AHF37_08620 [Paragonimus kellicotti]|nr:hypothetical protein AHF37_08620 [Paragonimus kellicotti]
MLREFILTIVAAPQKKTTEGREYHSSTVREEKRKLHPGTNVCSSNLPISSKSHDSADDGAHVTEDTGASSLRRSPMGASFHVVSNGCALSGGSVVPVENTTDGSICGDIGADDNEESGTLTGYDYPALHSVPGVYKQQPRLGVCSTTRVNKRISRSPAINHKNKQLATKLTDDNSQTSIEPVYTTEGNHTVTAQPVAVPMSNGAKLPSQPQQ